MCKVERNKRKATNGSGSRFLSNVRVKVAALYVPLVLAALSGWEAQRLYVALDTTVLWNRYCMIHLSVVWGGRAIPFLWQVIEPDVRQRQLSANTLLYYAKHAGC